MFNTIIIIIVIMTTHNKYGYDRGVTTVLSHNYCACYTTIMTLMSQCIVANPGDKEHD